MKEFTEKEFEKQLQKAWKELVINNNITKSDEPQAYIIGGQPGAGKSILVDRLMESNKNIMSIDADVCKTFHPRYNYHEKVSRPSP
ncbi:zeta toxin [Campylobacter sp. LR291e]|nr:zeta toxin family protein [Campylobacter sp. LR291e]KAA6230436.1 zeta toxin [Campylobacter sp. LR291e]